MQCCGIGASERFRTAWRSDWSNLISPLFTFVNIDQPPLDRPKSDMEDAEISTLYKGITSKKEL